MESPAICLTQDSEQFYSNLFGCVYIKQRSMFCRIVPILPLFFVLAVARLLHDQQQNLTYYEAMMGKEAQLQSSLAVAVNEIQYLHKTLDQLQGLPSAQIVALEDAMADENNILQEMAGNHTLPLKLKSVNCSNVSAADLQVLQASISQIERDLNDLETEIQRLNNTNPKTTQQLQLEQEWAMTYLREIQNVTNLLDKCPPPVNNTNGIGIANISNYTNLSNLKANPWIYGNTTAGDYYIKLFEYITTHNVTSCPLEAPFVLANTTNCSKCYEPTPIFDVNLEKCVKCPNNTQYNATEHRCVSRCQYNGQVLNETTQQCVCPLSNPYFNGRQCLSCVLPNFWNSTSQSCSSCNSTAFYNVNTLKCEVCPVTAPVSIGIKCVGCNLTSYYNFDKQSCVNCPFNMLFNPVSLLCECPRDSPVFNGTACNLCSMYQVFNQSSQRCENCSQGSIYIAENKSCQPCPKDKPIAYNNVCYGCSGNSYYNSTVGGCVVCAGNQILVTNNGFQQCKCPQSMPFFNGVDCEECYLPRYWNETIRKCLSCPDRTIYSLETERCTICPETAPLWSNGRCYPCPDGSYFSNSTNNCLTCQNGTVYNTTTKACQKPICQGYEHWNSTTNKCEMCPYSTFYNVVSRQCEGCTNGTLFDSSSYKCVCKYGEHWNATTLHCVACPPDTVYNEYTFNCEKCPIIAPLLVNGKCYSCPAGSYYDPIIKTCLQCEPGSLFNQVVGRCVSVCSIGMTFNPITQKCEIPVCPEGKHWNLTTSSCTSCPPDMVYNSNNQQCQRCPANAQMIINGKCYACPDGSYYDKDKKVCIKCGDGMTYNSTLSKCVSACSNGTDMNQVTGKCECPPSKPYFTGSQCLECYLPKYWDVRTQSCKQCPPGSFYNVTQQVCITCPPGYTFNAFTYRCDKNTVNCKILGQTYNETTKVCECPSFAPYADDSRCQACQLPRYWDYPTKTCKMCTGDLHYDPSVKMCVPCPNGYIYNYTTFTCQKNLYPTCSANQTYNVDTQKCECLSFMHWDGKTCVFCVYPDFWLQSNNACSRCPPGTHFNETNNKCYHCPPGFVFNIQKYTCEKNETVVVVNCDNNPEQTVYNETTMQCDCPSNRPYFTASQKCVACPLPYSYWNSQTLTCVNCPGSQHYDPAIKGCASCPNNYIYDINSLTCVFYRPTCSGGQVFNPATGKCECPANSVWNQATMTCQVQTQCGKDEFFSNVTLQCMKCPPGFTLTQKFGGIYECVNTVTVVNPPVTTPTTCPSTLPFWNGYKCIACYLPQYWDNVKSACLSCPDGLHYDVSLKQCANCQNGMTFDTTQYKCIQVGTSSNSCPPTLPFWNGYKCVACYLPKYWNKEKLSCEDCPANTNYDVGLKKCTTCTNGQTFNFSTYRCQ